MPRISDFTIAAPRPLPVIVLADISGSMGEDGKIDSLNHAIEEMLNSFAHEVPDHAQIQVAVITFGGSGARLHMPLAPATASQWTVMKADGHTPMGAAIDLARQLVENRTAIPARAYKPAIVLVSDGEPNDEWEAPLQQLLASGRGAKADRFALGIGAGAGMAVLQTFLNDPSKPVLQAADARQLRRFFQWVTMSVTTRSKSATPDTVGIPAVPDLSEDPF